ncbi:DUF3515 domain-containing protein [Actinosynnema sp. NPDC047251]|uniref:Putative secreted protein n=1 Tax=Saccharothrix espanaensis (strain ATCC 51144 / DSM 44229 / JCM 9112 / NBRC 15066 / NRRL 15764) TaxID=1179773 RepID=K0K2D0_SACES|nr:DUF3515 domain-containing protein [Saccharothrix espanaensis]CCH34405.1 putative secreted protein [Saccharothrix espanaensis DSM 44229]
MAQESEPTSLLPRPLLAVAIGLPALLAAGVAAVGLLLGTGGQAEPADPTSDRSGPLALVPVPAPAAAGEDCKALLSKLPMQLVSHGATLPRRDLAAPAPVGAVAWGDAKHEPIVLRCGLDRPGELNQTSELRIISDVQWLVLTEGGNSTWYVVDRPAYVALTVPSDAGTGPLQDISTTIRDTLPAVPVNTRG